MNRYRSTPGSGPPKATANTTCQKCLQKGHYSYECKATLQDRPYASRPSRSQQFKDPRLAPRLTNLKPNELLQTEGVADKVLADAEARRKREAEQMPDRVSSNRDRVHRSLSLSSVSSVATVSTNKSASRSPNRNGSARPGATQSSRPERSTSPRRSRKRRHESESSRSPSPSASFRHPRQKTRRHGTESPDGRGRPVPRRGSHRTPSRSPSVDKSQVTRHRRSLEEKSNGNKHHPHTLRSGERSMPQPKVDRRSLSPYSRRLALTQAMNMG